jgi:hypothetical protein
VGEYSKLVAHKIGPLEIIEKINCITPVPYWEDEKKPT